MAGPLKLPPGAVLVDDGTGTGNGMKLPPGATLVPDDQQPSQTPPSTPGVLSRFVSSLGHATGGQDRLSDYVEPFRHPSELKMLPEILKGGLSAQGDLLTRSAREYGEGKPIEGFTHGLEYMLPFIGPTLAKAGDQLNSGDVAGGVGSTAGVASMLFGPKAVEAAPRIPRVMGDTLKGTSYGLYNNVLGTKGAQMAYEGNPGRGVAQEGMVASSRGKLLEQINAAANNRSSQIDQVLQLPQNAGKRLDISASINDPFNSAINNGVSGQAPTGTLSRLRQTQRELTETRDPQTFDFTGQPKNLTMSPFDANQVKRGIYDRTNYRNPDYDEAVNNTLRQSGFGVKSAVNEAVPEVVPFNQRVSDLSGARGALSARINRTQTNPGTTGFKDVGPGSVGLLAGGPAGAVAGMGLSELWRALPVRTGVAQGLYRAGNLFSPDAPLTVPQPQYPAPPSIAGLLTSGPIRLGSNMEPISSPSEPPAFDPLTWRQTRADRRGLLLPEQTSIPLGPSTLSTPPSPSPTADLFTTATRMNRLLPEPPKQIPAYGYTAQNDVFGEINPPDQMAQDAASVVQRGPRGMFKRMYTTSKKP